MPGAGGIFEVRLDGETIWLREAQAGFSELGALRRLVRDRVAPERELGHSGGLLVVAPVDSRTHAARTLPVYVQLKGRAVWL